MLNVFVVAIYQQRNCFLTVASCNDIDKHFFLCEWFMLICSVLGACGSPPLISNAMSTLNSEGSSAIYQCLAGYELVDSSTNMVNCTDKGWGYGTIQCKLQGNFTDFRKEPTPSC